MSIILSNNEADGVEILKLVMETTDYYREMAEVLADNDVDHDLQRIANERSSFISPFETLVRDLGELPAQPDPDLELMQKLGGQLSKFFAADSQNTILDKCLREDAKLKELVTNTKLGELSAGYQSLLDSLLEHLRATEQALHSLKART